MGWRSWLRLFNIEDLAQLAPRQLVFYVYNRCLKYLLILTITSIVLMVDDVLVIASPSQSQLCLPHMSCTACTQLSMYLRKFCTVCFHSSPLQS